MSTTNQKTAKRSPGQAEQSRINGAKSQGPITPEGKQAISQNHMTHGFRSTTISIHSEDRAAYDAHLNAYFTRYTPVDKVEEDLVGLLASNMWQLMRNNSIEVALFDLEIAALDQDIDSKYQAMDQFGRLALAFKKSAGDNALELLRRYKATAERAYHRAFQALEQLQKERKSTVENLSAVRTQETPLPEPIPLSELAQTGTDAPEMPKRQPLLLLRSNDTSNASHSEPQRKHPQ